MGLSGADDCAIVAVEASRPPAISTVQIFTCRFIGSHSVGANRRGSILVAAPFQWSETMQLWSLWLEGIRNALHILSSDLGLGIGLGIIALTLATRLGLLPLTWSIGYRGAIRQKKMARLQPQMKLLKDAFGHDPKAYAARVRKLYAEHDLSIADGRSLLGLIAQAPILVGMYRVFSDSANAGRFL